MWMDSRWQGGATHDSKDHVEYTKCGSISAGSRSACLDEIQSVLVDYTDDTRIGVVK
jgi:hypothetical protein